jgi:hypothetical protein
MAVFVAEIDFGQPGKPIRGERSDSWFMKTGPVTFKVIPVKAYWQLSNGEHPLESNWEVRLPGERHMASGFRDRCRL